MSQAIIFGLFHGNILQGIYTAILGMVIALAYYWTRSIFVPIIIHITYNLVSTLIMPTLVYYTLFLVIPYLIVTTILISLIIWKMSRGLVNNHKLPDNNSVADPTVL